MPYLPAWSVELVNDNRHLVEASKGHNAVIASVGPQLGQVVAWRQQTQVRGSQTLVLRVRQ